MAPRGSNALGVNTDPYRYLVHTRALLPWVHTVHCTPRTLLLPRCTPSTADENSALGSMGPIPSGPMVPRVQPRVTVPVSSVSLAR